MPFIIFILSINIHNKYLLLDIELITICKFCPSFICISSYMLFPPSRNMFAHTHTCSVMSDSLETPKIVACQALLSSKRGFSRQEYCKWVAISLHLPGPFCLQAHALTAQNTEFACSPPVDLYPMAPLLWGLPRPPCVKCPSAPYTPAPCSLLPSFFSP